jgi:D-3-phosphoglycerate dehydrogenase / 2-oxoglutarate reductase
MSRPVVVYCGSNDVPVELIKGILNEIDAELVLANPKSDAEVAEAGRQADGMIFHGAIPLSRETLFALERCKVICRTGVGVDRMDLQAAAERNIVISNAAGCNSIEVAEHTIGLLLAMARKIVRMNTYVREGRWRRHTAELHAYRGEVRRVTGQTLGIVGLGHVGRQVAPRAKGVGLKVQAHDPFIDPKVAASMDVPLVPLEDLLRTSDFVSLHAPLYRDTRGLINARTLQLMKPTAYLINAARGPLVETDALMEALKEGRLRGASLDVTDPEPLPVDHPILQLDNVLVTCHTAANSNESYIDCQSHAAREVVRVLKGEPPMTQITDPWLLAEAADTGFGGV